jgi:outer membrane protein OmpA-like peptidoglycan-associated protein
MFSQDDDNQGLVLGVVFALIALVIALVVGVGIYKSDWRSAPVTAVAAAAPAPAADGARVQVVDGVVKFYFASGKADLAAGANQALADAVKAVAAGKTLVVSGFHDASGDAAINAELAKQRAVAVRDALKALGVAEDKVALKKPEQSLAEGPANEARRVEVVAK